jgi:hypothetical protein
LVDDEAQLVELFPAKADGQKHLLGAVYLSVESTAAEFMSEAQDEGARGGDRTKKSTASLTRFRKHRE